MGNVHGRSKRKTQTDAASHVLEWIPVDLEWHWSTDHEAELNAALQRYNLEQIIRKTVEEYLGVLNKAKKATKYNAYIHASISPLSHNYNPLPMNWLNAYKSTYGNDNELQIVMLGAGAVGKSALTLRMCIGDLPDEYDPTITDSYRRQYALNVHRGDYDTYKPAANNRALQTVTACIWDSAGCSWMEWRQTAYEAGQIFLLVFSIISPESFKQVQRIRDDIIAAKEASDQHNYCLLCVANKCDLLQAYPYCIDLKKTVYPWVEEHQMPYVETSAKTGQNVHLLYRQCVYELYLKTVL